MSTRITLLCAVMLMAATLAGQAGNLPYATDRAPLRVSRHGSEIKVEAYEWVATHDLRAGGCLRQVHLKTDVDLLGAAGGARVNKWYERCDSHPQVEVAKPDERQVVITVRGRLCDEQGQPSPITFTHVYRYRR